MIPARTKQAGALAVLVTSAVTAAVIVGGARLTGHGRAASSAPGVVSFEHQGRRCYTIEGQRGANGSGRGGSATVCGEGSQAQGGAAGGSSEVPPTYTIRNGKLMRLFADGRTEPVEVR